MQTVASMEWVRRVGDYRVLTGKRDALGCPLGAEEEARLEELTRFFMNDANRRRLPFAHREQIRTAISMVVQFGQNQGCARDISGDGMFVETEEPLPVGSKLVLRVTEEPETIGEDDPARREQWQFAAEVVRVEDAGMGVRFVGIPIAMRISHRRLEAEPTSAPAEAAPAPAETSSPFELALEISTQVAAPPVSIEPDLSVPIEIEAEPAAPDEAAPLASETPFAAEANAPTEVTVEVTGEFSGPVETSAEQSGPNAAQPSAGGDDAHAAA